MTIAEMIEILEEYKEKRGENTEIIVRITNPSTMDFDYMDPIFDETDEEILICADSSMYVEYDNEKARVIISADD